MTEPQLYSFLVRENDGSGRIVGYWSWGDVAAKKVIFCLHGMTRNGRDFDFLARRFMPDFRVICPDVAGRGTSGWIKDKSGYHNFTYAVDMLRLISFLRLQEIYWIGTSMGGLIGMIVAALRPGVIRKMVINDVGPFITKEALKRIAEYTGKNETFPDVAAAKVHFKKIYSPWKVNDFALEHMMKYGLNAVPGGFAMNNDPGIGAAFRDEKGNLKDFPDMDLWQYWEKITCPVLLLRGAESDILSEETAEKMTQTGPRARLIEFPGIGHAPSLMEEAQVEEVSGWLRK